MLHAGLDLSRRRVDVCLMSAGGELVEQTAAPPDADGLRGLAGRLARYRQPVRAVLRRSRPARTPLKAQSARPPHGSRATSLHEGRATPPTPRRPPPSLGTSPTRRLTSGTAFRKGGGGSNGALP
jgi:hypothetical protein